MHSCVIEVFVVFFWPCIVPCFIFFKPPPQKKEREKFYEHFEHQKDDDPNRFWLWLEGFCVIKGRHFKLSFSRIGG